MFTGVRFYTAVVFLIQYCSCLSYLFLVSPDVVGIGSEYFVVYLSCVYILRSMRSADYVELPVILYLLQCLVYRMLSKMKRGSGICM